MNIQGVAVSFSKIIGAINIILELKFTKYLGSNIYIYVYIIACSNFKFRYPTIKDTFNNELSFEENKPFCCNLKQTQVQASLINFHHSIIPIGKQWVQVVHVGVSIGGKSSDIWPFEQ